MSEWVRGHWREVVAVVGAVGLAAGVWLVTSLALRPVEVPVARSYTDYGWLRVEEVTLSATGTAGAATGTGDTDRRVGGRVYAVHVDYTAGISTTTDVTLTQASPSMTVLALTDVITDGWYYPTVQVHDSTGSTRSWYETTMVADHIDIEAGETTSGTVAVVTVYWGQ